MPFSDIAASVEALFTVERLGAFLATRWGQYAMIFTFFGLVIAFLRMMYGPRGFFRDPEWDRWNEEARRKAAAEALQEVQREAREVRATPADATAASRPGEKRHDR